MFRFLTGGRPMKQISFAFEDVVTGMPVFLWQDSYGRRWLAEHRWSWFRVRANEQGKSLHIQRFESAPHLECASRKVNPDTFK